MNLMGHLFAFSLSSSIILAALYLTYKWLLADENAPRRGRVILIIIYLLALLAPSLPTLSFGADAPQAGIEVGAPAFAGVVAAPSRSSSVLFSAILALWALGALVVALRIVLAVISVARCVRRAVPAQVGGVKVRLSSDSAIAPFSVAGIIVIPLRDALDGSATTDYIIAHERAHVSGRHWLDLVVANAFCIFQWFNPAAWLMLRQVRDCHEFLADAAVIDRGCDITAYQHLLLKKAVGARFHSFTDSLNHSNLKKRITMMYSKKPRGLRLMRPVLLAPALLAALSLTRVPAVADVIGDFAATSFGIDRPAAMIAGEDSDFLSAVQHSSLISSSVDEAAPVSEPVSEPVPASETPETVPAADAADVFVSAEDLPEYPGGMQALMQRLVNVLSYPAKAMDEGRQGKVVVQFVVRPDGSVSDPEVVKGVDPDLDAAAVDAVMQLGRFNPGTVGGKPVAVYFTLPIVFRLQPDETPDKAAPAVAEKTPAVMIDGRIASYNEMLSLNPDDIKLIDIVKNDPAYPDGLIKISTK